jgi:hypothetical protein
MLRGWLAAFHPALHIRWVEEAQRRQQIDFGLVVTNDGSRIVQPRLSIPFPPVEDHYGSGGPTAFGSVTGITRLTTFRQRFLLGSSWDRQIASTGRTTRDEHDLRTGGSAVALGVSHGRAASTCVR